MCAIAAQVLQSHLYFYFLTFGRSEQVLGQPISKENIKLRDYSGDRRQPSGISSHTKSVEYRLLMRTGTHAKGGINNQFLITGFSIKSIEIGRA
jgi:hypothetical protein